MEPIDRRMLLGAAGLAGVAAMSKLASGGPLMPPPGPVSPTGRTLDEIYGRIARTDEGVAEPRIPVQSLPGSATALHVISEPGSYYLTGNIQGMAGKNGIEIEADNVQIDFRGHVLRSAAAVGSAIVISQPRRGLRLHGGAIEAWIGAAIAGEPVEGSSLHSMMITTCGLDGSGSPWSARLGRSSIAVDCIIRNSSAWGLEMGEASVAHRCNFFSNAGVGLNVIGGVISCCSARNHPDSGFGMPEPGVIHNCDAVGNRFGFVIRYGVQLHGNSASYNEYGVVATERRNLVENNVAFFNAIGFEIRDEGCQLRGNLAAENSGAGYKALHAGNLLIGNAANGNGVDFDISPGNSHGPIVNVSGVGDISSVAGANHPWANFIY